MFGAIHFICYINRLIATKVDSYYLIYLPTAHNYTVCLGAADGHKPVTSRSPARRSADSTASLEYFRCFLVFVIVNSTFCTIFDER